MKSRKKSAKKSPFYILWVPGSPYAPRVKFQSVAKASKAAKWLLQNRDVSEVYTLEAVRVSRKLSPVVHSRGL